MESAGANVPEELFEHIVWYVEIHNVYGLSRRSVEFAQALVASKRTLGSCALVSRYFAKLCRPRLFHSIILRSLADLRSFIALLDAAGPPLRSPRTFVHNLRLQPTANDHPWLHLVHHDLRRRLPPNATIDLDLDAAFFRPDLPARSLRQGLPRTLPRVYVGLKVLILRDVHFKEGAECVRLLGELPLLAALRLERVTWDVAPDVACYRRVHNRVNYIRVVERSCALFSWFLLARIAYQWWEPVKTAKHTHQLALTWDHSEDDVVADLCKLFIPPQISVASDDPSSSGAENKENPSAHGGDLYWSAFRTTPDIEVGDYDSDSASNSKILMIIQGLHSELADAFMPTLSITLGPARIARGALETAHLLALELDFGAVAPPALDRIRKDVWKQLAEKLATLRCFQRVKLLFPSLEPLKIFAKEYHALFEVLQGPVKVAYCYKEIVGEYVRERRVDARDVIKESQ